MGYLYIIVYIYGSLYHASIRGNLKYEPFGDEEFKHMLSVDGVSVLVLPYYLLGDVNAKNECMKPDQTRSTFVHLKAYNILLMKTN